MKITIADSRPLEAVKEEFNSNFPYLRIEFFLKPHKAGEPSPRKQLRSSERTIGECRTVHNEGHLTINPWMTVTELEERFHDMYGLNVQLFRKSGKLWLETTVTDSWTLEQQNQQGEALSSVID
jgi:hypothetical protein